MFWSQRTSLDLVLHALKDADAEGVVRDLYMTVDDYFLFWGEGDGGQQARLDLLPDLRDIAQGDVVVSVSQQHADGEWTSGRSFRFIIADNSEVDNKWHVDPEGEFLALTLESNIAK